MRTRHHLARLAPYVLLALTTSMLLPIKPALAETGNENPTISNQESGLVGYGKLRGDCQDYSGHDNHGIMAVPATNVLAPHDSC